MSSIPVFVGLDYHQDSVQVAIIDQQGRRLANRRCENDWQAVVKAVEPHGRVVRAAVESCCGAADFAQQLVDRVGWCVDLSHPGFCARMKQNPDKHDLADSELLADLQRAGYLPKVWLAPQPIRELRQLVRYRQQQVNQRRDVKLRVGALLREQRIKCPLGKVSRWSSKWVNWLKMQAPLSEKGRWITDRHLARLQLLNEEIAAVEKRLEQVTAEDPLIKKLLEQPGIGLVTACVLRAQIGRFDRFRNGKQLSHFAGLSPRNVSSGARQATAGLIKSGDPLLRATLIEAAHRLIWHQDRWAKLAKALRARGKSASVVTAAVANRFLRRLHHEMVSAK
jgi:transposase